MVIRGEELIELRKNVDRKKSIDKKRESLRRQRDELSKKLSELETVMHEEQEDVDRIEENRVLGILLFIIGQKDSVLTLEKKEAYAAALKYEACYRELGAVKEDIEKLEEERRTLGDCDFRYERFLRYKEAQMKASKDCESAKELLRIEEKIASCESRISELREAKECAEHAIVLTEQLQNILEEILYLTQSDGLYLKTVKYDNIKLFASLTSSLQAQLRRLNNSVNDTVFCDLSLDISSSLALADFLINDMLLNLAIIKKVRNAQRKTNEVRYEIMNVCTRIEKEIENSKEAIGLLNRSKSEYIYRADI